MSPKALKTPLGASEVSGVWEVQAAADFAGTKFGHFHGRLGGHLGFRDLGFRGQGLRGLGFRGLGLIGV